MSRVVSQVTIGLLGVLCLVSLLVYVRQTGSFPGTVSYQSREFSWNTWKFHLNTKLTGLPNTRNITDSTRVHTTRIINDNSTCDFHKFRDTSRLGIESPSLSRHLLSNCTGIIHNRVPKSASRTMLDVYRELSKYQTISVIFHDRGYTIDNAEQYYYIGSMKRVQNGRFVLISHHYFHNFTKLEPYPQIYINIIREPVSWFQSNFNWHHQYYHRPPWDQPISQCILNDQCFDNIRSNWGPMRFLCGMSSACKQNNKDTLEMVKRRIDEDYLVIGVLDELSEFNEVLEYLMPHMFSGLVKAFNDTQKKSYQETKTEHKVKISQELVDIIKKKMAYENDVYAYAKQKFDNLLQTVRTLKSREQTGS